MTDLLAKTARCARDTDIIDITRDANRLRYNRRLTTKALDALDPDGWNVLVPLMIHEHAQGNKVAPHMRARAFLKIADSAIPQEAVMDVPMKLWDALPTALQVQAAQEA